MNSKLWIAPLALAAVVACRNLLNEEPQSFITSDSFFQTEADLKSGVIAAYSPMRSGNLFNGWPWLSLELASDQVRIDHDEPNLETSGPDFLFYSTGSRGVTVAWRELYNMIFRANLVLANADRVQQWTNPALKPTYLAEAKFLRAYAYLWLTKLYDDVPLLLTLADHDNPAVARTPVDQVHQQIIKDLTEVEAVLPAKWGSSDRGRATRGAAQMALADLYLWRASFMKQTADWQNASDWAKKVIDSGDWGLSADYISTFLPSNKGNREMIFYVAASGVDSRSSTRGTSASPPAAVGAPGIRPTGTTTSIRREIIARRPATAAAAAAGTASASPRSRTGRCRGNTVPRTTVRMAASATWTSRCTASLKRS